MASPQGVRVAGAAQEVGEAGHGTPSALDAAFDLVDALLGVSGSAVVAVDPGGRVVRWNAGAATLSGVGPERALGALLVDAIPPIGAGEASRAWFAATVAQGGGTRLLTLPSPTGPVPCVISIRAVRGPDGPEGAIVVGGLASLGPEQAMQASLLEAIVGQSPVGVGVFDRRCRYVRVNPALQQIVGLPAEEMIGRDVAEVVPGPVGAFAHARLSEVLETGVPVVGAEIEGPLPSGPDDRTALVSYFRLSAPDGTVLGAASIVSGVSDQHRTRRELERANARLELLGRAAAVLTESLDLERTLAGLGSVVVPRLADHCIVDLVDDTARPGALRRYAIVQVDQEAGAGAWAPVGTEVTYPPGHPVQEALTTGEVGVWHIDPHAFDYEAVAPTEDSAEYARQVGVRAALTLPLRARGQVVGVLSLAQSLSGRTFEAEDLLLARQLADRAAAAIDNARLFGREQRHALELQRHLLPDLLPRVPGVRAAARYQPAAGGVAVGGDWYDLVPLPGGRVAIVIGDVMGRGVRAAALMGQVRAGLRAYAVRDLPPQDVLTSADELVRGLDEAVLVTCVYAVHDPRDGELVVANAGHVPPLLVDGSGAVELLPATGPPLGAGGREPYGEQRTALPPGALLALYTDGLVESREVDLDEGIGRLARLLTGVGADLATAGAGVVEALAPVHGRPGERHQDDDVALLLVASEPAARPRVRTTRLAPEPRAAGQARAFALRTLREWGEPEEVVDVVELATGELVANAVRYAGTAIGFGLSRHDDGVVVEVGDGADGTPRWRRAGLDDEGGRGLLLVGELAAAWGVRARAGGGKTVWCRVARPAVRA